MAVTMRLKPVKQQVMVIVGASSGIVGGSGKILLALNTLSPSLVDRALAHLFIPATHAGRPREGRANLFEPSESLEEIGDYRGLTRPSIYTALARRPALTRTLAAGAAIALAAWWRRRQA
jgi:hypothetical protein